MKNAAFSTLGIDLGKNSVHVFATNSNGVPVLRKRMSRLKLLELLANAPRSLVGMEACPGSNYLGREIQKLGHEVRLIPAQYVKPFVKTNKNDYLDAEAIAEAVTRPTMRFVPIKSSEQLDLQALHRVRDRVVHQRTALISQIRSLLLEYGIVMATGVAAFKRDLPGKLAEHADQITPRLHALVERLCEELRCLGTRAEELSREIEDEAAGSDTARRLMTIPGIGALGATGLFLRPSATYGGFGADAIWLPGSVWFRASTRPAEEIPCLVLANAATATCAGCSSTEHARACFI